MTDKIAGWIDERTSRKRFLGRTGKVMAGVGFGLLAGAYRPDVAGANLYCCSGASECGGCPSTVGSCPAGWTYTGNNWSCCWFNGQLDVVVHCWYCTKFGSSCICTQRTGNVC